MMISIIIPCYNSSNYIGKCCHCLFSQSDNDWEAIFINDGSIDNTFDILTEVSRKDSRIKVYSQSNKGAAKAREYGISKAKGDYITFLDVDDTLDLKAIEIINRFIVEASNADIIVTGFNIVKDNIVIKRKIVHFKELDYKSFLKTILRGKYGWELCGKVYRRELFDSSTTTPTNFRIGEDAAVFIQIVTRAEKIIGCNYPIYNYIQYLKSASHIKNKKYAEETLLAGRFIEDFLKLQPFYNEVRNEISAMHLLFYSNSSFKYTLSKNHPLVKYIIDNHLRIIPLLSIPILKSFYILFLYLTDGKITEWLYKLKR